MSGWRLRRLSCLAPLLAMAGCLAGPNFRPPAPPAVSSYAQSSDRTAGEVALDTGERPAEGWWRGLGSPKLDAVIARAIANSPTVAAAQATLERAEAQAARERARLLPQVNLAGSYQRERINTTAFGFRPIAGFPGFGNPTIGLYSIGPSVSYDLDLAGGARRRLEEARALAEVARARADAAYLSLTANIAMQGVRIAQLEAQQARTRALIANDEQQIAILKKALALGGGAPFGTVAITLQLQNDQALLPPIEQQLAAARHALASLVGEPPAAWTPPEFSLADFAPAAVVPVAVPSILVRERPDIQAALAQVHADTAEVGVQSARLYPDLRLTGSLTQEALSPGALFGYSATAYSVGPTLTLPLFDGGAIRADRRAARAAARASLAQYQQTVVAAFTQVADVLSALAEDDLRLGALKDAESTAQRGVQAATADYRIGGGARTLVVTYERQLVQAAAAREMADGQRLGDIVSLYAATARNWSTATQNEKNSTMIQDSRAPKPLAPAARSP